LLKGFLIFINYFYKKEGFLKLMSYINNRCKKLSSKVIMRYSNVKNLFNHKRLAIAFFFKEIL